MKAVRISQRGGPEVLRQVEVPDPAPGPNELLVRVRASAANRADLLQCLGLYPAPPDAPPDIPGLEYAGEVVSAGPRVRRFRTGDRVMGVVAGGAYAELLVVHEREAVAIPEGMPFVQAAAIPEAFTTAFDALVLQGAVRSGEAVLIHAVASGVGTAAIQLVHALGAVSIGTSRSPAKLSRCSTELGLVHALPCEKPVFADRVKAATQGRGADLALDLAGGPYFPETVRSMAERGRMVSVGLLAGPVAEVPLSHLLMRRLQVTGTVLRSRPIEEKIAVAQAFERQVIPLFASGRLRPVIDSVLPMEEARVALERLSRNDSFGKLVLQWETR